MKKIQQKLGKFFRLVLCNFWERRQLKNKGFSIISQNCIGSVMYSDLNHSFLSPTINLYMGASDFVRFVERLDYYLSMELRQIESKETYPVGVLDDVCIHFVHYPSFAEAKRKWEERKKRVNYDKLFIIMTDRDGCDQESIDRFRRLSYPNKVMFTNQKLAGEHFVYVPGYDEEEQVGNLVRFVGFLGKRGYKVFNYVEWLNRGMRDS